MKLREERGTSPASAKVIDRIKESAGVCLRYYKRYCKRNTLPLRKSIAGTIFSSGRSCLRAMVNPEITPPNPQGCASNLSHHFF